MPVVAAKGKIINEALLKLGSEQIASLDDGSDKSAVVSALYDGLVNILMTMRTWRFTCEKRELARLDGTPINGFKYAYQLPSDLISGPWVVYNSRAVDARASTEFEIYGDKLLTDYEIVIIDYQVEVQPGRWPVYFRNLVVNALAAEFAIPITESPGLFETYDRIAYGLPADDRQGGLFRVAAQADAKGTPSDQLNTDALVAARLS